MSETDANRPEESTQADVTLVTRGITVTASVDRSDDFALVLRPVANGPASEVIKIGDAVEIYWVSGYEERTLPAKVAAIDESAEPSWTLRPTGPAERSQRRKSVRGRVELPIVMPWAGGLLRGLTVDLSEGGMKALVDGWGLPPESGTPTMVTMTLEDGISLDVHGEVVWTADRGTKQWILAIRFTQVSERDGDTLRRRVFRALREERAFIGD
jgi:hypothetical protein